MADLQPDNYYGYYEMYYWHTEYFDNTADIANVNAFQGINLFVDQATPGVNYEHLFLTYDIYTNNPTSAPPSNSLYDLANFQQLLALGQSTPNILSAAQKTMIFG